MNRLDKQFKKAERVLIYIRLDKLNCTSPMATNHAKFIHSLILKIDHLVQIFQTFFTDFGKTKTRKTWLFLKKKKYHTVWKLLKMSHLEFSTNFCPIKVDLCGNTIWPQALSFPKLDKFWQFLWTFVHSESKCSSLRSQCWMRHRTFTNLMRHFGQFSITVNMYVPM